MAFLVRQPPQTALTQPLPLQLHQPAADVAALQAQRVVQMEQLAALVAVEGLVVAQALLERPAKAMQAVIRLERHPAVVVALAVLVLRRPPEVQLAPQLARDRVQQALYLEHLLPMRAVATVQSMD